MVKYWWVVVVTLALVILVMFAFGAMRSAPEAEKTSPAEATPAPSMLEKEIRSGDGAMTLAMEGRRLSEEQTEYVFRVKDGKTGAAAQIFSMLMESRATMDIPFNAWSPNNKQLFVEENGSGKKNYFVFRADGIPYSADEQYLDVGKHWENKGGDLEIETITGWGGIDLLVVRTKNKDGDRGPSFWFVTSSRGFLQLRQT